MPELDLNQFVPEAVLANSDAGSAMISKDLVLQYNLTAIEGFHPIIAALSEKYPQFLFSMNFDHLAHTQWITWSHNPHKINPKPVHYK